MKSCIRVTFDTLAPGEAEANTFGSFSSLPAELRLSIWNAAFTEPSVVAVVPGRGGNYVFRPVGNAIFRTNEIASSSPEAWHEWMRRSRPIPAQRRRAGESGGGGSTPTQWLRIDPARTIFVLGHGAQATLESAELLIGSGVDFRHVAFCVSDDYSTADVLERMAETVAQLETAIVVVPRSPHDYDGLRGSQLLAEKLAGVLDRRGRGSWSLPSYIALSRGQDAGGIRMSALASSRGEIRFLF